MPSGMTSTPEKVDTAVLDDLRDRIRQYRAVPVASTLGPKAGIDSDYLADLLKYWGDGYDWRPHEERIRALPWVLVETKHGSVRMIHRQSQHSDAMTVVLLHGWPDSVLRFERVLPLLADYNVIAPALPGYPFAAPVPERGMPADQMAEIIGDALHELGCNCYVLSAGDIGSMVAESLAALRPDAVAALHLTDVSQWHAYTQPPSDPSEAERDYLERNWQFRFMEGGYALEQSTKPRTLAIGLGDSPAGLAAWLLEKFTTWTDNGGDVEKVFSRDELLTWITAYWVTSTIGTSFTPYGEGSIPDRHPVAPTVFTLFPKDLANAPREFAGRIFDVRAWHVYESGGHFASWEQPERYAAGVSEAVQFARDTRQ